jgi:F1F0 ATPase subunit 2
VIRFVSVIVGLIAGLLLGTVFFGGLWWTVRRGLTATTPAVWFGLSALARMAAVICGLYYCARVGLPSLIACLCGLLIARSAVRHFSRLPA